MAEKEIMLRLRVDATQAVSSVDEFEQSLKDADKAANELGDAGNNLDPFEQKLNEINKTVKSGELDFRQLRKTIQDYQSIALAAGRESPVGQEALQQAAQLRDQLVDLDNEVKRLSHDGANMQAAMQLGQGVLAGFTAFKGVTAALGVENENLQKTLVQLQGAQAALVAVEQLRASLEKESFLMIKLKTIATKGLTVETEKSTLAQIRAGIATKTLTFLQGAYNAAVGTSTGLMKVFRIALASTGLGAIVVGLVLLIANFDLVKDAVTTAIEKLFNLKTAFLLLLGPIGWLIIAYKELFGTIGDEEDKLAKKQKELRKQEADRHNQRIKEIEKEKEARIDASNKTIKALELEKDTLEANGKSSDEVTLKILENELEKVQAVFDANKQKIDSWIEYYKNLAALRGEDLEEFKKSMRAQGIDLDDLQRQANELLEENQRNIQFAENKITKFRREQLERQKKDKKDQLKDLKDLEEDWQTESIKSWSEYNDKLNDTIEIDEIEPDIDFSDLDIQIENTLSKLEQFGIAVGEMFRKGIDNIPEDMSNMLNNVSELSNQAIDGFSQINDILNELGDRRIEKLQQDRDDEITSLKNKTQQELNNEKLSAREKALIEHKSAMTEFKIKKEAAEAEDRIAKKQFERHKAIKLAEIAIDTAAGVVKALGAFPPPASFIVAGITGGIGAAQAALVASQRFKGSAGSVQPPSLSLPEFNDVGGSSSSGASASTQNTSGTATGGLIDTTSKVVVSQVEINEQQDNLSNIAEVSTIG